MIQTGAFDHSAVRGEVCAMYRDAGMICACCDGLKYNEASSVCDDCDDPRFESAPW